MFRSLVSVLLLCCASAFAPAQMPSVTAAKAAPELPHPVLDRIRANHVLNCGLAKEEEDYSRAEDHGNRAAFDIDICKAIGVAVLGAGSRLVIKSYPDEPKAVQALAAGEVDVLASASMVVANTARGLLFTQPSLLDGQGFLLLNNPAVHGPQDLAGKKLCFLTGSYAENGLHTYADAHHLTYGWYPFSEAGEEEAAFFTGNCDALTSDLTSLANIRDIDERRAHEFTILPQVIRQDPLGPAVLGTDPRLAAIVGWTISALLEAEELGITQSNVRTLANDPRIPVQQLLGQRFGTGTALGIDPHWAAQVLETVGNYGEIFDRDLGSDSRLRLDRGDNRLWANGGALYPLPVNTN